MQTHTKRPPVQVGNTYYELTVVAALPKVGARNFWRCLCSCGNSDVTVRQDSLKSGHVKSCGCLRVKTAAANGAATAIHGMTGSPEHLVWVAMWQRCTNPNHTSYSKYRHRVPVDRWKEFTAFYKDMGPRPSTKHSVERVDNDKPYGPDNCVWATTEEQSRNMSSNVNLTYDDKTMCAADWAKETGINAAVIRARFHAGWDTVKILNTKVRN